MDASVGGIFAEYFPAYQYGRRLPLHYHKAAYALAHCRTAAMGWQQHRCPSGHYQHIQANSCRHRSCPRCSALARERWVQRQQAHLLACDHYHMVFTLPHELLPLFGSHRRVMVDILFRSVRDTLMTLLGDERWLGVTPGVLMTLHTWGRNLSYHPHIHCLVTAGGLTPQGQWRCPDTEYLLPVRVVRAFYRNRFLEALGDAIRAGHIKPNETHSRASLYDLLSSLRQHPWHVRLKERYAHGRGVMTYLSRYVKGGPIKDTRVCAVHDGKVRFTYKDHRDAKHKTMRLPVQTFLQRLLWHLPERYQHQVRTIGLYAHRADTQRARCRRALRMPSAQASPPLTWQTYLTRLGHRVTTHCPTCGTPLAITVRRRQNQTSYLKIRQRKSDGFVQQEDEMDVANVPKPP